MSMSEPACSEPAAYADEAPCMDSCDEQSGYALTIILTPQWETGTDGSITCGGDGEELRDDINGGRLDAHTLSECADEAGR